MWIGVFFSQFYAGTLDPNRLINLVNAVCRRDCVGAERYCYATVRGALVGGRGISEASPLPALQHGNYICYTVHLPAVPLSSTQCATMLPAPVRRSANRRWTRLAAVHRMSLGTNAQSCSSLLCCTSQHTSLWCLVQDQELKGGVCLLSAGLLHHLPRAGSMFRARSPHAA